MLNGIKLKMEKKKKDTNIIKREKVFCLKKDYKCVEHVQGFFSLRKKTGKERGKEKKKKKIYRVYSCCGIRIERKIEQRRSSIPKKPCIC